MNSLAMTLEEQLGEGMRLAESEMWREYVEDMEDEWMISSTAHMLENTRKWMQSMSETTRAVHVGDFEKYAFPLVRAIFPELVASSIVSVQPMLGPTSLVFYLDFVFGSSKGAVKRGDKVFDSIGLGPGTFNYSGEVIEDEAISTGGITKNDKTTATLSYGPIRPGTVRIAAVGGSTQILTDDGNGGIIGAVGTKAGGATNTINYATGALSCDFAADDGTAVVTVTYEYNMETNTNIPEVDLMLTSSPVIARPRKLRTRWGLEAAFHLRSLHGLEAEVELTAAVGSYIRFEIDREIISDLNRIAGAGSVEFDAKPGTNVSITEHYLSFQNAAVRCSNLIFQATGRAVGTWMVLGVGLANIVETLPGFVPDPGLVSSGMVKGVIRAGRLYGRFEVFKDPFFTWDAGLMGYKGNSFLEAGYIYAPYIPLYTTPTVVLDDFMGRKGLSTLYGRKAVNSLFYAKLTTANLPST